MRGMSYGFRVAAILTTAALLTGPSATPFQQKKQSTKKATDTFVNGAPFSFEQVLSFVRENAIPFRRQKEAIFNRGLDFSFSPEDADKLKAAGASQEMLDLIKFRAKPAPPVVKTPPAPRLGDLSVTCAPAECEISVGGIPKGATSGGVLKVSGLKTGSTAVDFKRAGYIGSQAVVVIEAGKVTSAMATLEPDEATKEAIGAALFTKMVEALGGARALGESLSIQAEGSATVWAADGRATRWSLFMRNNPERALFQVQGGGGVLHEVAFTGSQYKTSKGLKGEDARELPTDFGLLRDHQIARLITRLSTQKFRMMASAGTLAAEGSTETISISLDNDSRPAQVKFTTATGLGGGIVTYSDYILKGKLYYPRSMQIRPDASPRGVGVHFDRVELSPKLKDSDYNLRNKFVPSQAR
jgi:hypothetical protein